MGKLKNTMYKYNKKIITVLHALFTLFGQVRNRILLAVAAQLLRRREGGGTSTGSG
jgi:hypothetical protein